MKIPRTHRLTPLETKLLHLVQRFTSEHDILVQKVIREEQQRLRGKAKP